MIGKHQERTEAATQNAWNTGTVDERNSSTTQALWQNAHSLAVIADALDEPEGFKLVTGPPENGS